MGKYHLFRRFFFINLVSIQYGIDSTLWLPTVFTYLETLTGSRASFYLSLAQFLPAVIQFFVSLLVGPLMALTGGSIKWAIVAFVFCSAIGNFLYSCAAEHGIGNEWAIIGGRMLCGLSSGSFSLAMSYIVSSTTTEERLPSLSLYRTFAGVALVIGPLLSVVLTLFTFYIGKFAVSPENAPTFVSSAIALVVALVTALFVKEKKAGKYNIFSIAKNHSHELKTGSNKDWAIPLYLLVLLFFSAFLMSNVFFLMSDLLRSSSYWHYDLTLISGLQAIVFFVSLVGSLYAENLRKVIQNFMNKRKQVQELATLDTAKEESNGDISIRSEAILASISFAISIVGAILVIIGIAIFDQMDSSNAGAAACFLIGCIVYMIAYNIQAASLPSLYSKSVPGKLRLVMVPWYGATVALGKIAGPPIIQVIGDSTHTNHGWIGTQGLCIALSLLCSVSFFVFMRPLASVLMAKSA